MALDSHVPAHLFGENVEINAIFDAEQPELDRAMNALAQYFYDTFPKTASLSGIERWEMLLDITANPSTENLRFRRERIINRIRSSLPYTERTLHDFMDAIMGADGWDYTLDVEHGTLIISSLRPGKLWLAEMEYTLKNILPANIEWTLSLFFSTWQSVYDDYDTWQAVYDTFDTWENVLEGI